MHMSQLASTLCKHSSCPRKFSRLVSFSQNQPITQRSSSKFGFPWRLPRAPQTRATSVHCHCFCKCIEFLLLQMVQNRWCAQDKIARHKRVHLGRLIKMLAETQSFTILAQYADCNSSLARTIGKGKRAPWPRNRLKISIMPFCFPHTRYK